ncbi:MAG: ribosomal protein [Pseudomonadota bacterium]|jgi:large subunit ribosomal protein L9
MNVILQSDFPSLGYVGDLVAVKPGYARNYLIPRGIAVEASSTNARLLKHRMDGINAKKMKLKVEAEALAQRLGVVTLDFTIKMGSGGRSFGAITVKDVDAALKTKGFELDKKQIKLLEPFKKPGEYKVNVKLHSEVTAFVNTKVVAEVSEKKAAEEGEAKPKKSRKAESAAAEESAPKTETAETPAE